MSALRVTVLAATLLYSIVFICSVKSQKCDNVAVQISGPLSRFLTLFFRPHDGASLNKCTFNGQQCCKQFIIDLFDEAIRIAINNGSLHFTAGFTKAQKAVDKMRNDTNGYLNKIESITKQQLLSAVPRADQTSDFRSAVDDAMKDMHDALIGSNVDLKVTFRKYFKAIAVAYFNKAIDALNSKLPGPLKISVNSHLASCGTEALFDQIYSTTDPAVQLIDLIQNIARAFGVIIQLPSRFDKLLQTVSKFQFSDTCLDVFSTNYLCPLCRDQPLMCPGRCAEVVTGCVSPLHQSIVQLDASLKMILSIVKGLIGTSDSATDSINIKRFPVLFEDLVASIQKLDFLEFNFVSKILTLCGVNVPTLPSITLPTLPFTLPTISLPPITVPRITLPPVTVPRITLPPVTVPRITLPPVTVPRITLPPVTVPRITLPPVTVPRITLPPATVPRITLPPATFPRYTLPPATIPRTVPPIRFPFGKRSLMAHKTMVNKRALNFEIPHFDTTELESQLDELETQINSAMGGNKIASVTNELCSPDFSVKFNGIAFKTTAANGMCSYGAGNTGNYSSTFSKRDIIDQAYGNPAGHFNYTQLLNQAKMQTYVLTELFHETDIPKSLFSVFMPGEMLPTTGFLSASPPSDPNPTTPTPANNIHPTDVATTDSSLTNTTSTPTGAPCTLRKLIGRVRQNYSKQKAKFTFRIFAHSSDATFECNLDNQGFNPCKSPVNWKNLSKGNHVVIARASCTVDDETWNVEKSFSFHI